MNDKNETGREAQISNLLKKIGARKVPPATMAEEIKASVKAVWLEEVKQSKIADANQAEQQTEHQVIGTSNAFGQKRYFAIAATIALSIGLGFFNLTGSNDEIPAYAMVDKFINHVEYQSEQGGSWRPLDKMDIVGSIKIRTQENSFASINMKNGLNLRLSENSLISLNEMSALNLESGAIYVDSNDNGDHKNTIKVSTPFGSAQDIGTQFSVNLLSDGWQVLVREGSVHINNGNDLIADAGEQITMSENNQVDKSSLKADDAIWNWTQKLSSDFDLEGSNLASYLYWVARETGKSVEYESDLARMTAASTILKGSIEGIEPLVSLSLVIPTTDLHIQFSDSGKIIVGM